MSSPQSRQNPGASPLFVLIRLFMFYLFLSHTNIKEGREGGPGARGGVEQRGGREETDGGGEGSEEGQDPAQQPVRCWGRALSTCKQPHVSRDPTLHARSSP